MLINLFWSFLITISSGIIFIVIFKKLSLKYNLLTLKSMPLTGGISICLAFFIGCFYASRSCGAPIEEIIKILIPSFLMLIFGVLDDCMELSIALKFITQFAAASLLIFFGIRTQIIYFNDFLNIIITYIWIIGITNALNLLDIIDGLAAGDTIIICAALFVISLINFNITEAVLSLCLLSSVLAFFIFNFPPAKVYLGNSGSHFLGFILAAITLNISYASINKSIAIFSPIVILGFPIMDTIFLILIRSSKKILPFKKSADHLALRLSVFNYSKKKTVLIMLGWCLFFSICGIIITQISNSQSIALIIAVIIINVFLANKIARLKSSKETLS